MRRFVALSIAICCATALCWSFDASSAYAGAVAGDIGSTISVGVSSPGSGGALEGNNGGSSESGTAGNGHNAASGGSGNGGSTGSTGSTAAPVCAYKTAPAGDQTSMGPPGSSSSGQWYLVECIGDAEVHRDGLVWIPTAAAPGAAPAIPVVDPALVAQEAENSMRLPSPQIETNPSNQAVVNLPTWLWLDQGNWNRESVSASVGTVTATATATPEQVQWTMGDGGSLVCDGPGTAYQPSVPAGSQTTSCSYTYSRSSAGEPSATGDPNGGRFPVTATITWGVTWTAQGVAAGGVLNPLTTSSSTSLSVEQIQSVSADSQMSRGGAP